MVLDHYSGFFGFHAVDIKVMSIKVEWMRTLAVADATLTIFLCWIRAQICLEQICFNPKGDRQDSLP